MVTTPKMTSNIFGSSKDTKAWIVKSVQALNFHESLIKVFH